jgi:hypothetical protein
LLHRVASALLAAFPLSKAHREALRRRGLDDAEICLRGYGTMLVQGRARIARDLHDRFGDACLRVPGVIVRERDGRRYLTLAGAAGLLIPVRDLAGLIVALLARRDDTGEGRPRYSYISSAGHGGPGPGAPVHVPFGVAGPVEVVRVTEGVLKSDVAHALSQVPTIGLPGVGTWRPALEVLRQLGTRTVRLAMDADSTDKPGVARPLTAFADALRAEGFTVEFERWPAGHKGIDDALAAAAAVEVLTGDASRRAIVETLATATAGEPPRRPAPARCRGRTLTLTLTWRAGA